MKRATTISLCLLTLCASAFGQASSYGLKNSDITDVDIDSAGWLVGKGRPDADDLKRSDGDQLITKVVYPIRFTKKTGSYSSTGTSEDIKAWKFGDKAFVVVPRRYSEYLVTIHLVTVSLDIPSVEPNWKDEDIPVSDPLDKELRRFAERAGVDQDQDPGFKAFFDEGSLLKAMADNRADVNNFDEAKEKNLVSRFRVAQLAFFKDKLSSKRVSRYDALGYSQILLPSHLMRLARHFSHISKVEDGSEMNDLMLLNRCLIDGVGEGAGGIGLFQGETYDLVTGKKVSDLGGSEASGISVTRCPVFPITTILGINDRELRLRLRDLQMRLLTADEVDEVRQTDPRTLTADKAGPIPKDASDADLEPYVVLENGREKWFISKKGYWIGHAPETRHNRGE